MLPRYHPRFAGEPARLIALTRRIRRILRRSRTASFRPAAPGRRPARFPADARTDRILSCAGGNRGQPDPRLYRRASPAIYIGSSISQPGGNCKRKNRFFGKNGASRAAAPFCRRGGPAGPYRSRRGKSAGRFRQCASGTVSFRRLMIRSAQCFSKNSQRR